MWKTWRSPLTFLSVDVAEADDDIVAGHVIDLPVDEEGVAVVGPCADVQEHIVARRDRRHRHAVV
ncbi:MAG: hypothetical protein ABIS28_13240, partial [Caldimonas sp.]